MAKTNYQYTKAVSVIQLENEIRASAILTALDSIALNGATDLSVWFKDALSSGDEAILSALVTAHVIVALVNVPNAVSVVSQPDPPPFAQPTYRTKLNATADLLTVAPGANQDIQFKLTQERYVTGGAIIVKGAQLGDYVTAEVEDIDGLIPAPYRAALCESWPIISTYIEKQWVEVQGEYTVMKINTYPLNAKISAGLYLCVHYYAAAGGSDRTVGVNYSLTKKL